jgi:hypothetical protein
MSELEIQDAIRIELGNPEKYPEIVLFRNNCGVLTDKHGRYVRYGVGSPGGSDLVGIFAGRFIALEIKTATGKESDEQRRFGALVESKGGSYAVLRSVEDARAWVARLRTTEKDAARQYQDIEVRAFSRISRSALVARVTGEE